MCLIPSDGTPTSVDFVRDEPNRMVTAFASSHCVIYDLETAKPVIRLESSQVSVAVVLYGNCNSLSSFLTQKCLFYCYP